MHARTLNEKGYCKNRGSFYNVAQNLIFIGISMKTKYLRILTIILGYFISDTSVKAMDDTSDKDRRAPSTSSQPIMNSTSAAVNPNSEEDLRSAYEYLGAIVCTAVAYRPELAQHLDKVIQEMIDSISVYEQASDRYNKALKNLSVLLEKPVRRRLKDAWPEYVPAIGKYYIQQGKESLIMQLVDREILQQENAWNTPELQCLASNYAEALLRGPWIPDDERDSAKQKALDLIQYLQQREPNDGHLQMLLVEFFLSNEDPFAIEAFKTYCTLRKAEISKDAVHLGQQIQFTDDGPIKRALQIKPDLTRRILEELGIPEDFTAFPRKSRSTAPAKTSNTDE